jgi:hypothetical protein
LFLLAVLGALLAPAAPPGGRVSYVGGTRSDVPSGCDGIMDTVDDRYAVFYSGKANLRVAYDRVNLLEYGQNVSRRYAMAVLISPMFMLAKKRQHFLTIGYQDEQGRQQALVFRVDKADIRTLLVTLEARTGQKVQFQDNEARKAGRG